MAYYKKLILYTKKLQDKQSVVSDLKLSLDDFGDIVNYTNSGQNIKQVHIKAVQVQLLDVLNEIKSSIPYGAYNEFISKTDSLSNTNVLFALLTDV